MLVTRIICYIFLTPVILDSWKNKCNNQFCTFVPGNYYSFLNIENSALTRLIYFWLKSDFKRFLSYCSIKCKNWNYHSIFPNLKLFPYSSFYFPHFLCSFLKHCHVLVSLPYLKCIEKLYLEFLIQFVKQVPQVPYVTMYNWQKYLLFISEHSRSF